MFRPRALTMATCVAATALCGTAGGAEHPFILWTKNDAAELRKKIQTQPWARAAYDSLVKQPHADQRSLSHLLRYLVRGDTAGVEAEKKELMTTVRSPVPRGAAQWINVLRYDVLYDRLSADERRTVERCFREYIENHVFKRAVFDKSVFNNSRNYARYDAKKYTRSNWLPNIIWPWKVSANLMAVALRDEKLIRRTWSAYGSWKWYFDEYLCDIGFYSEEFSKMGATPGAMILYCLGLERLGLNDLGFGYQGAGGAAMRGHIASLLHLGYPRVDIASTRPHYPMVTMGDLRHSGSSQHLNLPGYAFQHSLVMGYTRGGAGGNERWVRHGAWGGPQRGNSPQWDRGKTPKMQIPLWFEFAHKRWPKMGFDYFLAQMRPPGKPRYYPSLWFGLDATDPSAVKPPAAPSAVWSQRGLVMLRADESGAYWESPAPAVCMRLASSYAHRVNDSFALLGFYAFNRPIYLNRQSIPAYAQGYSRSIQSHCGVTVDAREPAVTSETTVRQSFSPEVKFVAAHSTKVYPQVDLTRALMLTREYLLDVTAVSSQQPRRYHWLVHALGRAGGGDPWQKADRIDGLLPDFKAVRKRAVGEKPWSVTVHQDCPAKDPAKTALDASWYAKGIGVRMSMLGQPDTTAWLADTPQMAPRPRKPPPPPDEIGGTTIVAQRTAKRTVFGALHVPFESRRVPVSQFRRIAETNDALAVAVVVGRPGTGIDDRLLLRFGKKADEPVTLAANGESFTFANYAYIRVGRDRVRVRGDLKAMKLRVAGRTKLLINGKPRNADHAGSFLTYDTRKH